MSLWNKTYDRVQNFSFVFIVDYQRAIYFDITFSELKDGRLKAVVCADEVFLVWWYNLFIFCLRMNDIIWGFQSFSIPYLTIVSNLKYLLQ